MILAFICFGGLSAQVPEQNVEVAQGVVLTGLVGGQSANFSQVFNRPMNETYNASRMTYRDVGGSPYLYDEPVRARVVLNDGSFVKEALMKFDLYADEIIVSSEEGSEQLMDKSMVVEIIYLEGDKVISMKRLNIEDPSKFYVDLYRDERLSFCKERYATVREGENMGLAKVEPKFVKRQRYFIKTGRTYEEVKLSSKDILNRLSRSEALAIENYAKENKIKLKKEEDFVKVFTEVRGSK